MLSLSFVSVLLIRATAGITHMKDGSHFRLDPKLFTHIEVEGNYVDFLELVFIR